MSEWAGQPLIDVDLLRRFDATGPRYTSYPTADRFVEAHDADSHGAWLAHRATNARSGPCSLYFHIPFCANICYYCACNKIITKDHGRSAKYLRYLENEMDLVLGAAGQSPAVSQMHWGGGTPTFLSKDELEHLVGSIRQRFKLLPEGEYSIEVDPRTADAGIVGHLGQLGFNRISLGVQDFNEQVQRSINRVQSIEQTASVVTAARAGGFQSVNMDLIYGLPHQTEASFRTTIDAVLKLEPDRIALYNYAHLPHVFKPQRRIDESTVPGIEERLMIFWQATQSLIRAGYAYVGLDHFAKPGDDLAIAQRQGRLHRNFQGYSTQPDCDLLAFGISAISKIGPSYAQNVRTLDEYYDRLDRGTLPIMRGVELSHDDLMRREIIQALMCNFAVSVEAIELGYLVEFESYFQRELSELDSFVAAGLVEIEDNWVSVTQSGRFAVRGIAMIFDRYLRDGRGRAAYSKVM
jgi:oxygen-independent coproporphyrinogen-3 oxidase